MSKAVSVAYIPVSILRFNALAFCYVHVSRLWSVRECPFVYRGMQGCRQQYYSGKA